MTQKEKLLKRLSSIPRDFSINELNKLMQSLGYKEYTKGRTAGSRIAFYHPGTRLIIKFLRRTGDID